MIKTILSIAFSTLIIIPQVSACSNAKLFTNKTVDNLVIAADQISCQSTRQVYQCEKLEKELKLEEKNNIIKCDKDYISQNGVLDIKDLSCLNNGIKESIIGSFVDWVTKTIKDKVACDSDINKKKELISNYNFTVKDQRFQLDESYFGKKFPDIECSKIEKDLNARYQNYLYSLDREKRQNGNISESFDLPKELKEKSSELLRFLDEAFKQADVAYECYSPKAKAEMVCAGITSLITDGITGAGILKAAKAIKGVVKSKRALASIEKATALGEGASLDDAGLLTLADRSKAAESVLKRTLNNEEKAALAKTHEVGIKEGRGYFAYTQEDINEKAKLLKEAGFSAPERRSLMENGIAGTQSSVKPQNLIYWHEQRIKGEKLIGEFANSGNKEKLTTGLAEGRKFYQQFLDPKKAEKFFPADREGFLNIISANVNGLSSKESLGIFENSFKAATKEATLANYKNAVGSMNNHIKEYEEMMKINKSGSAIEIFKYKIYRAYELRGEIIESYYEKKYANKYNELDWDKMNKREQDLLSRFRDELQKQKSEAARLKIPTES